MLGAFDCCDSVGEGDRFRDSGGESTFPLLFVVFVFNAAYLDLCMIPGGLGPVGLPVDDLILVGLRPVVRFQYVCAPKSLSSFNSSMCLL